MGRSRPPFAGADGHLDQQAVIERMIEACPDLEPVLLEDDEIIGDLPYLQVWRNHASVNSIRRPRSIRGVTLRGGRSGQFCPAKARGSEPA